MSNSTKAMSKPKRPLSGYNLFYRYKRNMVVEATARDRDGREDKAVVRAVLAAVPGLEGAPPDSPALDLPPARLDELRAANIRTAMEGKLFPNENARKRQHCRVHGMGFVEMGRMMRDMWGRADKLTKDVFCDLADVGRVRYKRLVAEYNECKMTAAAVDPTTKKSTAEAKAAVPSFVPHQVPSSSDPMLEALSVWATGNPPPPAASSAGAADTGPEEASFVPQQAHSSSRPALEARRDRWSSLLTNLQRTCDDPDGEGPLMEREDGIFGLSLDAAMSPGAEASPAHAEGGVRPSQGRRVSGTAADIDLCGDSLFEPLPVERAAMAAFDPISVVAPSDAGKRDGRSQGRRVSAVAAELDLCDASLFEPLPVERAKGPVAASAGRRVSTDISALLDNGSGSVGGVSNAPAAVAMSNGSAGSNSDNAHLERLNANLEQQQLLLRNAIQDLRDKIIRNNSMLPSDMRVFPKEGIAPRERTIGENAYLEIMTSRGPSAPSGKEAAGNNGALGGADGPAEGGASARDFAEFIDELGEAIDYHGVDVGAAEETKDLAADGARERITDGGDGSVPSLVFGRSVYDMPGPDEAKDCTATAEHLADDLADGCHPLVFGKSMFDMPGFDFRDKPVPPLQNSIPMPAGIQLKTNRARMA